MIQRLPFLWPEIALFIATCVVMVVGLSPALRTRKLSAIIAGLGVAVAGILAATTTPVAGRDANVTGQLLLPSMVPYAKVLIAGVGLLLLMLLAGTVDRAEESAIAAGRRAFDPLRSNRAEFYAFYLFSLTGLMLCADADDLIWLFLALELTSLPTYIMVTISTARNRSREAGVKYFFLGALGAAVFLYGFALIYGGTGSTNLNAIADSFREHGVNSIALAGMLLSLIGLGFKIAAVPMHFYTADVYEGAAPQVSAFLAFVPKTAGFLGILLLTATMGWSFVPGKHMEAVHSVAVGHQLPEIIRLALWVIAALTMTVGNVLAILQSSVKRILAYSSIAHSGYMLVGVIAGPGDGTFTKNGLAAVLFYLMAYGLMNMGCFAVLAALERRPGPDGESGEVESVSDLRGLCFTHPALGWTMVLCALSLLGFPPLLGFFGKVPLFTSAISAGEIPLVVVLGVNSAIAAYYYLRIAFAPLLERPDATTEPAQVSPFRSRQVAGVIAAATVVVLALGGYWLMGPIMDRSTQAGAFRPVLRNETSPRLGGVEAADR
jgi:NADH-quinone oxidoreductase subunit N